MIRRVIRAKLNTRPRGSLGDECGSGDLGRVVGLGGLFSGRRGRDTSLVHHVLGEVLEHVDRLLRRIEVAKVVEVGAGEASDLEKVRAQIRVRQARLEQLASLLVGADLVADARIHHGDGVKKVVTLHAGGALGGVWPAERHADGAAKRLADLALLEQFTGVTVGDEDGICLKRGTEEEFLQALPILGVEQLHDVENVRFGLSRIGRRLETATLLAEPPPNDVERRIQQAVFFVRYHERHHGRRVVRLACDHVRHSTQKRVQRATAFEDRERVLRLGHVHVFTRSFR